MKRKEENRSVIEPSCTFFKPNKIHFLSSNWVLDRKPDRVTGYKVLIDLTSLMKRHRISITRGRLPGLSQERMQEPIKL